MSISFILFVFGSAIGSFLNVVALRYDGEHFLFDPAVIGGRSHCPQCERQLHWFELIPILSFLWQGGTCRGCHARIGWQYPAVEILMGVIFAAVPLALSGMPGLDSGFWILDSGLWILVFVVLALISYIDIRLAIIPDECHWMLGALAILVVAANAAWFGTMNRSLLGPYAWLLGFQQNIWATHIVGMIFGFLFFELLVLVTHGRGMGMGDVKLALPLGFLFGWPDIIPVTLLAFVIGAVIGIVGVALQRKTMKGTLPFGPFLAISSLIVFFFGSGMVGWYVKLLGM